MYLPDIPISVAFGGLIAASNLGRVRSGQWSWEELRRRSFWQVVGYGLLFHCVDSLFAFVWYGDWNLAYVVPFARVGYAGAVAMEAGLLGLLLLGRWLVLIVSRKRPVLAWAPILASLALFGAVMVVIWDRYQHVGSYDQYHQGTAVLATTDPVFTMFTTLAGAYLLVPLAVLIAFNIYHGRGQVLGGA